MELRPLGFGEIFDRAITLYIKNFIPFVGIVCVLILPLAVIQYFLDLGAAPQWDQTMRILEHPNAPVSSAPVVPYIFTSPLYLSMFVLLLLVLWGLWPFALNACTIGVARLYRGRRVEFETCYRASLRRWPAVLGLLVVEGAIFVGWYVLFLIAVFVSVALTTVLFNVWVPAGVIAALFALVLNLALLIGLAPLVVALTFAMNAIVVEEQPVFASIALGFSRVFNRQEFWRAMLFSFAVGAILMGASAVTSIFVFAAMMLHWIVAEVVVTSLFRAAFTPFGIVLMAVYYFDVRIRREGYDLEAGLERLTSDAAPA